MAVQINQVGPCTRDRMQRKWPRLEVRGPRRADYAVADRQVFVWPMSPSEIARLDEDDGYVFVAGRGYTVLAPIEQARHGD
jgi:hypothetical protein